MTEVATVSRWSMLRISLLGALVVLCAAPAAGAVGPVPDVLVALPCIEGTISPAGVCPMQAPGVESAVRVAVSPDGQSVYTTNAGTATSAIARFVRQPDGSLAPAGCIQDKSVTGPLCGAGNVAPAIVNPHPLVVSPDGTDVYVGSRAAGHWRGSSVQPTERSRSPAVSAAWHRPTARPSPVSPCRTTSPSARTAAASTSPRTRRCWSSLESPTDRCSQLGASSRGLTWPFRAARPWTGSAAPSASP